LTLLPLDPMVGIGKDGKPQLRLLLHSRDSRSPSLFCVDQEHTARLRQALINENSDLVAAAQNMLLANNLKGLS
jgi:hypothetical protein